MRQKSHDQSTVRSRQTKATVPASGYEICWQQNSFFLYDRSVRRARVIHNQKLVSEIPCFKMCLSTCAQSFLIYIISHLIEFTLLILCNCVLKYSFNFRCIHTLIVDFSIFQCQTKWTKNENLIPKKEDIFLCYF